MAIVVAVVLLLVLVEGIFIITPSPAHIHTHRSRVRDVQHIFFRMLENFKYFFHSSEKSCASAKNAKKKSHAIGHEGRRRRGARRCM